MNNEGSAPKRNVAIFIDMENLFGGYKKDVTWIPIGRIVREIEKVVEDQQVGALTAAVRAYANWGRADMGAYRLELLENGVEPVQVFSFNKDVKNAADIGLAVDVLAMTAESPWVDVFVIVSGDGGYVPLIRRLHVLGKYAIVVTTSHRSTGTANEIIKKVADYFHIIDVPDSPVVGAHPIPPRTGWRSEAQLQTAPMSSNGSRRQEVKAGGVALATSGPSVEEYANSVRQLVRDNPGVLVSGTVNGARLGVLLKKRWPSTNYTTFGFGALGSFVEQHCGLKMYRPQSVQSAGPRDADAPIPVEVQNRPNYIDAIRELFKPGGYLTSKVQAAGEAGLPLADIEKDLRELVIGRTYQDVGYPDLRIMLRHALVTTALRVVEINGKDVIMPPGTSDGRPYEPFGEAELYDPDLVRSILGAQEPRIIYPAPTVLSDVIGVLETESEPMNVAELIDLVADKLPDTLAEDIREALGLLWEIGVLVAAGEDARLRVDLEEADDAMARVIADAQRRAEEVDWPIDSESIEYIIF